MDLIQRHRR